MSRRSTRERTQPQRLGFESSQPSLTPLPPSPPGLPGAFGDSDSELSFQESSSEPLPTVEPKEELYESDTPVPPAPPKRPKRPSNMSANEGFTAAQQLQIAQMIAQAMASLRPPPAESVNTPARSQSRALTADLQPIPDYYVPVLDPSILRVEPSKVKYPRHAFSDHQGEVQYDAWKMDMKLFIEEFSGNFTNGMDQAKAYFKCTTGEAKTIILEHLDPEFHDQVQSAQDVLRILDQRFF